MKTVFFVLAITLVFISSANLALALDLSQISGAVGSFLSTANDICMNIEPVVKIIIGTDCTSDLNFLLTLALWVVFLMLAFDGIASFTPFSRGVSFVIALAFVITLANVGHFLAVTNFIVSLISTPKGLAIVIVSFIIILIFYLLLRDSITKGREKRRKAQLEESQKIITKTGQAISKAFQKE